MLNGKVIHHCLVSKTISIHNLIFRKQAQKVKVSIKANLMNFGGLLSSYDDLEAGFGKFCHSMIRSMFGTEFDSKLGKKVPNNLKTSHS